MPSFPPHLKRFSSSTTLAGQLALHLEGHLRRWLTLGDKGPRPLGLATGRTMEPVYAALVSRLRLWNEADLKRLRSLWCSFNLDEYVGLLPDHQGSYRHYMRERLGDPLQLPVEALQLPDGSAQDTAAAARSYAAALQRRGGVGLQLLGLGSNGHVGFNEPPSDRDRSCHAVTLSPSTRLQNAVMFGGDPAAVPERAITLGLAEILAAEEIHLVVTGPSKAAILARLLRLDGPDPSLPASWLLDHPNVCLWGDAASLA